MSVKINVGGRTVISRESEGKTSLDITGGLS